MTGKSLRNYSRVKCFVLTGAIIVSGGGLGPLSLLLMGGRKSKLGGSETFSLKAFTNLPKNVTLSREHLASFTCTFTLLNQTLALFLPQFLWRFARLCTCRTLKRPDEISASAICFFFSPSPPSLNRTHLHTVLHS